MDIYLMQHGEAKTKEEDPDRPLTDRGRATVERIAKRAREGGVSIELAYHSGIVRARQTAEILAGVGVAESIDARDGLEPLDAVEPVARWLAKQAASSGHHAIALVGHLPFMDRLCSRLVAGHEDAQVVAFQTGGLVKLAPKRDGDGFAVAWVLAPELV